VLAKINYLLNQHLMIAKIGGWPPGRRYARRSTVAAVIVATRHECELQLEVEDIHHRAPKPKVRKPKAFVSASHKNVLNEFNGVTLLPPLSQKRSEFKILRTTD
jgi:hypothetical protein